MKSKKLHSTLFFLTVLLLVFKTNALNTVVAVNDNHYNKQEESFVEDNEEDFVISSEEIIDCEEEELEEENNPSTSYQLIKSFLRNNIIKVSTIYHSFNLHQKLFILYHKLKIAC